MILQAFVHTLATFSAVSSMLFAAAFVAYLEMYEFFTGDPIVLGHPNADVPKYLILVSMVTSFISSIATIIAIWL